MLGWRVNANFEMIPGSARIVHTGFDWCGNDPEYAKYGGIPCDMPISPGLVARIIQMCSPSAEDTRQLQKLYNEIAELQLFCAPKNQGEPERLVRRAARDRGKPLAFSWDAACDRGYSYQGYGLDELLRRLLLKEAAGSCPQCGAGDCTHEAARLVVSEIERSEQGLTS
jgi:hypothetical protein